jgi:hypothetical protein
MNVAILVPVCSRNQNWKTFEDCHFAKYFYPSFRETTTDYTGKIQIYVGIDDNDAFFREHLDNFKDVSIVWLAGCQHAPAYAWNQLLEKAVQDGYEYFYQVGDDIVFEQSGWLTQCLTQLHLLQSDFGIVGLLNEENANQRVPFGKPIVIENAFFNKKHWNMFKTLFTHEIKNWYCDDWITRVYGKYATTLMHLKLKNMCRDSRYNIENAPFIDYLVERDRRIIHTYEVSHRS